MVWAACCRCLRNMGCRVFRLGWKPNCVSGILLFKMQGPCLYRGAIFATFQSAGTQAHSKDSRKSWAIRGKRTCTPSKPRPSDLGKNCTAYFRKGLATISKPEEALPFKRFKCSARRVHMVSKSGAGMESGGRGQPVAAPFASS